MGKKNEKKLISKHNLYLIEKTKKLYQTNATFIENQYLKLQKYVFTNLLKLTDLINTYFLLLQSRCLKLPTTTDL